MKRLIDFLCGRPSAKAREMARERASRANAQWTAWQEAHREWREIIDKMPYGPRKEDQLRQAGWNMLAMYRLSEGSPHFSLYTREFPDHWLFGPTGERLR